MGKGKAVLFAGVVLAAAILPGMVAQDSQEEVKHLRSELKEVKSQLEKMQGQQANLQEVRARRFVVVDEKGDARATLGMGKDQAVLVLCEKGGKPCCVVGTYDGKIECRCIKQKER